MHDKKSGQTSFGSTFHLFATKCSYVVGTKWAFVASMALIALWAVLGPHYL